MSQRARAADIAAEAAAWVVRQPLSPAETAELARWLDADPRHRGAYTRAEAGWGLVERLKGDAVTAFPADAAPVLVEAARPPRRARYVAAGLAAACAVAGLALWRNAPSGYTPPTRIVADAGKPRRVALPDGSVTVLDAGSVLDVAIDRGHRRLTLLRGEAWFQVAHDRVHPFTVFAGSTRAEAVGTAFDVRRDGGAADVAVTEGIVRVQIGSTAPLLVRRGEQVALTAQGTAVRSAIPGGAERLLAWREDRIDFDDAPLAEAVAQLNRGATPRLVIADPQLARERITGTFGRHEPEAFARAVAAMFGGEVVSRGNALVVSRVEKAGRR